MSNVWKVTWKGQATPRYVGTASSAGARIGAGKLFNPGNVTIEAELAQPGTYDPAAVVEWIPVPLEEEFPGFGTAAFRQRQPKRRKGV